MNYIATLVFIFLVFITVYITNIKRKKAIILKDFCTGILAILPITKIAEAIINARTKKDDT